MLSLSTVLVRILCKVLKMRPQAIYHYYINCRHPEIVRIIRREKGKMKTTYSNLLGCVEYPWSFFFFNMSCLAVWYSELLSEYQVLYKPNRFTFSSRALQLFLLFFLIHMCEKYLLLIAVGLISWGYGWRWKNTRIKKAEE